MINNQLQGLPAGIYFNLSNEDYRNDPAVSNSDIKKLLISPLKYWRNSILNPKTKYKETPALKMGKALHCYLMERERFYADYIVLPKLEVDSDFYRSESEKPDFLQNFALRKTKDAKTFEYIGEKIVIKEDDFEDIKERVEYLEEETIAAPLFQDGFMEVSIFWQDAETGIMCKCRFDYLAKNYITDYKSIEGIDKIANSIGTYDYYLQQAFYLEGLRQFKKDPVVFLNEANDAQAKFCADLVRSKKEAFIFVFQEKEDLMVRLKTFHEDVIAGATDLFRRGLQIYKTNIEKYGVSKWKDDYKKHPEEEDIEVLNWDNLPMWIQYKYN